MTKEQKKLLKTIIKNNGSIYLRTTNREDRKAIRQLASSGYLKNTNSVCVLSPTISDDKDIKYAITELGKNYFISRRKAIIKEILWFIAGIVISELFDYILPFFLK